MPEIVDEIAEYITEPDANVARAAVAAIGKLGVRVPECGGGVVRGINGLRLSPRQPGSQTPSSHHRRSRHHQAGHHTC